MLETPTPNQLPTLSSSEFLPRLSPWAMIGGGFIITLLGAAVMSAAVLKYSVAVKVPATIRPTGDLRLVQAAIEGTVEQIVVQNNQSIAMGEPIAYLDDSRLDTTQSQLQGDVEQQQIQLTQIKIQISALDSQILAESNLMQRTVQAEQAELESQQRLYQNQQVSTNAEFQEATAALRLAEDELARYQQLADTGAIATLMIKEKETAVAVAASQVDRAASTLNPTDAAIAKANQQIAQAQAQGEATLATLQQQRGQLLQTQTELQSQLDRTQKELQQVKFDFSQRIIRAPIAGTLMQLNLRNAKQVLQPGEAVAYIAPLDAPLLIKAQVPAQDIDKVRPGQNVQMQVSACPYPDYGTLKGTVKAVAPDALPVANTGTTSAQTAAQTTAQTTYEITIQPQTTDVGTGDRHCQLQAGMEGRADIISRQETVLQFVLRKARLVSNL